MKQNDQLKVLLLLCLKNLGLILPDEVVAKIIQYVLLLKKWNRIYNLTAISDVSAMITHHIVDSLAIMPYLKNEGYILDIGSGAGLPGIPLGLALPNRNITLLDSQSKKVRFLRQVITELNLSNVAVSHSRVEEFYSEHRFSDIITRATFSLADFWQKTNHLLSTEGQVLLMKGKYPTEELARAPKSCNVVVHKLAVPGLAAERHLVQISRL